jgi:integrase/recombinase XerD
MKSSEEKMGRAIEELLDQYELYARAAGFSNAQVTLMRMCVGLFDRFLGGIKNIKEITAADFRHFLADLRDRPVWQDLKTEKPRRLSGTSINTYARSVKTFFHWLNTEGIITNNPLTAVPAPRKPKTLPKVYSEKDLKAVWSIASSNIRDEAVFCLFLDSGIRRAELGGLKIGNIDLQSGFIKVFGKGNKERFSYLSSDGVKIIDLYIKEFRQGAAMDDFLFVKKDGQPLKAGGIRSLLLRLGKEAGLNETLSAHKLRHTFATTSLKYGGNLEYIRKMLGHTNIKTTSEAYLNVQDSDVSTAHQRFSPLSNLRGKDVGGGFVLSEEGRPSNQLALPGMNTGQHSYEETSHERQIRQLAGDLINGLSLPSTKDSFILELWPGRIILGKERFAITVTEKGKIRFGLSIADKGEISLFHQALLTHLETAGLANVLPDILSWSEGVANNLKNCHELLKRVRTAVTDTYQTSIPIEDDGNPGFTMDFPILICASAVEQASGSTHFKGFQYRYEGLRLKFGGFQIYIGTSNEDLKPFEDAHINLRKACAMWQQTKAIAKQRQDLNGLAVAINQQLQKFIAFKRLPGRCELCS